MYVCMYVSPYTPNKAYVVKASSLEQVGLRGTKRSFKPYYEEQAVLHLTHGKLQE